MQLSSPRNRDANMSVSAEESAWSRLAARVIAGAARVLIAMPGGAALALDKVRPCTFLRG